MAMNANGEAGRGWGAGGVVFCPGSGAWAGRGWGGSLRGGGFGGGGVFGVGLVFRVRGPGWV